MWTTNELFDTYTYQQSIHILYLLINSCRTRPYYGYYTFLETWNIGNHLIHSNSYSIYRLLSTMRSSEEQVTTNLPAILYIGTSLVEGTRGRFSVDKAILTWFSTFHFILLFVISALVIIHLLFLNEKDQTIFQEFHLTKFHFTPIIQSKIF